MQRILWVVLILFSGELLSNNLILRNNFHQSVQSQEFETFEDDDGSHQAVYSGYESIRRNCRVVVAGVVFGYSFAVTLAILNAHALDSKICKPKFHETVSESDAVCYDY